MALTGCIDRGFNSVPVAVLGGIDTGFPNPDNPQTAEEALRNPCAICHSSLDPAGDLNLEFQVRENLVDQRSVQSPTMFRVVPGDVEASYLIHKLRGTHLDVDGLGDPMPSGNYRTLTPFELGLVEQWIEDGAPPFL